MPGEVTASSSQPTQYPLDTGLESAKCCDCEWGAFPARLGLLVSPLAEEQGLLTWSPKRAPERPLPSLAQLKGNLEEVALKLQAFVSGWVSCVVMAGTRYSWSKCPQICIKWEILCEVSSIVFLRFLFGKISKLQELRKSSQQHSFFGFSDSLFPMDALVVPLLTCVRSKGLRKVC